MTADNSACFSIDSKPLINCEVCSILFQPRQKNGKFCSRACYEKRKRVVEVGCVVCKKIVLRRRHGSNDSKLCCSRECGFRFQSFMRNEISTLRRIANKVKESFKPKVDDNLIKEIQSLKLITSNNKTNKLCKSCGEIIYSKYVSVHPNCRKEYESRRKNNYKNTDAYKVAKKASKAKRKALERGATIAENINPISILERDKWKCYLCGVRTPKKLRGTSNDNAPEVDHIIPLSKGGLHIESNLRCCCRKCNGLKSNQIYQLI